MQLKIALIDLEMRIEDLEMRVADLAPPLGKPGGVRHTTQRIDEALPDGSPKEKEMIDIVNKGDGISNQDARLVYRFDDCNPAHDGMKIFKGFCVSSHGQFRMDQRGITVRKIQDFFFNLEKYIERNQTNRLAFDLIRAVERGEEAKWTDDFGKKLTVVFRRQGDSAKIITAYYKNKKDPFLVEESKHYSPRKRRRRS